MITKWHVLPPPSGNGWSNIGYNYIILNGKLTSKRYNPKFNGHLETGRGMDIDAFIDGDEIGAHTRGYNRSVGICLIGNSGQFTTEQLETLVDLIRDLRRQFGDIDIKQHSDYDPEGKPNCAGLRPSVMQTLREYAI